MRDEVLQKALGTDTSVIPRYDIILPDGTKFAENVQLVLKNAVLTAGTPLNKGSLLRDTTAALYGIEEISEAVPDDVLVAIRNSAGYCPKLKIFSVPGATITMQEANTAAATTYTVPTSGVLSVDILRYGTYKIWTTIGGLIVEDYIDITETKQYSINIFGYVTYVKVTVTQEIGATVQATHTDGSVSRGIVGADKTCTIALYKQGTWNLVCTYDGVASQTYQLNATFETMDTTIPGSPAWTKLKVEVAAGATVTVSKGGVSKSAVSIKGSCTFWMPDADTWSISASLNGKHGSGFAATPLYTTKTVGISLS